MSKTKLLLPLIALLFIAASCSKEKRLGRKLARQDGKWNITEYVTTETSGGETVNNTYLSPGSITFDKSAFVWTMTVDGYSESYGGNWTNSDDQITLIIFGSAIIFDIEDETRNSMTLKYSNSYDYGDGDVESQSVVMKLKKD